jgi:hypothetical protein
MENNNNNINNNDDDDNSSNQSNHTPIQRRGLLSAAIEFITTPLRQQTRAERQAVLDQQRAIEIATLEEDLGLDRTNLFRDEEKEEETEEDEEKEEETEEEEDHPTMTVTSYSFGGMSLDFDQEEPDQNTDYEVGVVISKANRPAAGSDDERKLVEGLCKNQYPKFKKAETSMKSVERLLQSRGIMDTIGGTSTLLNKYDMQEPFTVVYPEDPTLKRVALQMEGGVLKTTNLLHDFRKVTKEEVALSCKWWNLHGHYKDKDGTKCSFGRDMNWSYLHFNNHVEEVLYNDTNKIFHDDYSKQERGGPLFFKLLIDSVLTSNENSLSALVSTIKKYNIATDGKDNLPESIKILEAGVKTIKSIRADGSNRPQLPDKFVVDVITVMQTTSVDMFNEKIKALHNSLDLYRLMHSEKTINTTENLNKVFSLAKNYHEELFNEGIWHEQTMEKAKSSFLNDKSGNIFWFNRCWNCKKIGCHKTRCEETIDEARCERHKNEWAKENNREPNGGPRPNNKRGNNSGSKPKPFAWREPEPSENNKRIIYGDPHTWNGKSSWIKDNTPSSGLPETPLAANTAGNSIPAQVQPKSNVGDDATVMTTDTGVLTQEGQNEIRRIQANVQNLGANLASVTALLSNLSTD